MGKLVFGLAVAAHAFAAEEPLLKGIVVNAITGAPVRKASITLAASGPGQEYATAVSSSNGQFVFPTIPPGSYKLFANSPGWVLKSARGGLIIKLPEAAAQEQRIALLPLGVISGRVLDEAGEPIVNAQLQVLKVSFPQGRARLSLVAGSNSDDRGQYRFFDLLPGNYQLRIQVQGQSPRNVPGGEAATVYAAQYYGGGSEPSAQAPLVIQGGEELTGFDFRLTGTPSGKLTGRIAGYPPPTAHQGVSLWLQTKGGAPFGGRGIGVREDGSFLGEGLEPGSYTLVANLQSPSGLLRASQKVELAPGQTTEASLVLSPGSDLMGTVFVDEHAPGNANLRVSLQPVDESQNGPRPTAQVAPDGKFTLTGVSPGVWDIEVSPLPRGGFIKSMLLGKQDVLREEMSIRPGTQEQLKIGIGSRAGKLEGGIAGSAGLQEAPVVLLAPEGRDAAVHSFYMPTVVNAEGRYRFASLRPGAYKLYAFSDIETGVWFDPSFLPRYSDQGLPVTIREGESTSADAPLVKLK